MVLRFIPTQISALLATSTVRSSRIVLTSIVPRRYTSKQVLTITGQGDTMNVVINFGVSTITTIKILELICLVM